MSAREPDKRSWEEDPRLGAAFVADPALADEIEMILPMLDPPARERFEALLAEEVGRHERPAAAVLAALERAARGGG
ncbi:MAG: hypothetical protein KDB58_06170 [Solirubrobacterales bacterium]|nr:hypothetical protein [Solirubrobacterales bacterium]MCB1009177.1 hypothetical protein [Acidobacteriota bacterium]MCB8969571.1 hypothetical protein [Thermoleophilales bacterium]MCO5326628.1 hypothetical protein [Solirubrobacterales bacterium]